MAISFRSAIMCDDIRQEGNGKYILIGAYAQEIVFPHYPTAGNFMLFCFVENVPGDDDAFHMQFYMGEMLVGEMRGQIALAEGTGGWIPVGMPPLSIPAPVDFKVRFRNENHGAGEWTEFFSIAMNRGPVHEMVPPTEYSTMHK